MTQQHTCTFLNCRFVNNIIDWFNAANDSKFALTIEEKLFGIISGPYKKNIREIYLHNPIYYIYTSKMHNQANYLSVFVINILFKYRIENLSH